MTTAAENRFDFITSDKLRASLVSDFIEMSECYSRGAWKAVHVLSGAIVEAILLDHLLAIGYNKKRQEDLLSMTLGKLLEVFIEENIISQQTNNLGTVIKGYRNLIHPGVQFRTQNPPDKNSATIATSLVDIIVKEISDKRKDTIGYTADQLVNKIQIDSSSVKILRHLVNDMNEFEKEKLLLKSTPNRYFALQSEEKNSLELGFDIDYFQILSALSSAFRYVFDSSSDEIKARLTKKFVLIVREEGEDYIEEYQDAFFKSYDLKYLNKKDKDLIKDQVINRINKRAGFKELNIAAGLWHFLDVNDIARFLDPLIKCALYDKNDSLRQKCRKFLETEFLFSETEMEIKFLRRMDDWINLHKKQENLHHVDVLETIKREYVIP